MTVAAATAIQSGNSAFPEDFQFDRFNMRDLFQDQSVVISTKTLREWVDAKNRHICPVLILNWQHVHDESEGTPIKEPEDWVCENCKRVAGQKAPRLIQEVERSFTFYDAIKVALGWLKTHPETDLEDLVKEIARIYPELFQKKCVQVATIASKSYQKRLEREKQQQKKKDQAAEAVKVWVEANPMDLRNPVEIKKSILKENYDLDDQEVFQAVLDDLEKNGQSRMKPHFNQCLSVAESYYGNGGAKDKLDRDTRDVVGEINKKRAEAGKLMLNPKILNAALLQTMQDVKRNLSKNERAVLRQAADQDWQNKPHRKAHWLRNNKGRGGRFPR